MQRDAFYEHRGAVDPSSWYHTTRGYPDQATGTFVERLDDSTSTRHCWYDRCSSQIFQLYRPSSHFTEATLPPIPFGYSPLRSNHVVFSLPAALQPSRHHPLVEHAVSWYSAGILASHAP